MPRFNIGDNVIVQLPSGVTPSMLRTVFPNFNKRMDKTVGMHGVVKGCESGLQLVQVYFDCIKDYWWYKDDWLVPAIEFNEEFDIDDVIL